MAEETNTNASNTPVEGQTADQGTNTTPNAENAATAQNTQDNNNPTDSKPEDNKDAGKETKSEPELTLESYNDLGLDSFEDEYKWDEAGVKEFKEVGLKNKVSPEAMKAIATWAMNAAKKQAEAFQALRNSWNEENQKTYGDNLKNVKTDAGRVLAELDKSGKFMDLLKSAGAEEAPATLGFLKSVGEAILEKGSINPNATIQGKEMTLEDIYKPKQ